MSKISSILLLFSLCWGLAVTETAAAAPTVSHSFETTLQDDASASSDTLAARGVQAPTDEANVPTSHADEQRRNAAVQSDEQSMQFSGQLFTHYRWNTAGTGATKRANSFALERWYVTVKTSLSEQVDFRGTTDVRLTDAGQTAFVKYAYVDWRMQPGLSLRAGVHQTGWQNYMNAVWGYRGVAKTMAQYQGHVSMADLGATLTADLPASLGQAAVGVLNGTGYRSLETDRFKDVTGQLRLTPFADGGGTLAPLQIGGHVYRGQYADARTRQRWGGMVAYDGAEYTLAVNYEGRKDGAVQAAGVSGFGTFRLATVPTVGTFELLGLVDVYQVDDPDDLAFEGQTIRSIVGLAYQPTDGVTLSLDYQQNHAEAAIYDRYNGELTDVDARLYLHVIVNY